MTRISSTELRQPGFVQGRPGSGTMGLWTTTAPPRHLGLLAFDLLQNRAKKPLERGSVFQDLRPTYRHCFDFRSPGRRGLLKAANFVEAGVAKRSQSTRLSTSTIFVKTALSCSRSDLSMSLDRRSGTELSAEGKLTTCTSRLSHTALPGRNSRRYAVAPSWWTACAAYRGRLCCKAEGVPCPLPRVHA